LSLYETRDYREILFDIISTAASTKPRRRARLEETTNSSAPINDKGAEIYGQSTNGAGDRSAGGSMRSRRAIIIAAECTRGLLHHPEAPRFYFIIPTPPPVARARIVTATAITHRRDPCNPFSRPCRDAISQRGLRCSSLACTYRHPRPRHDIIPPEICCGCTRCFRCLGRAAVYPNPSTGSTSTGSAEVAFQRRSLQRSSGVRFCLDVRDCSLILRGEIAR